MILLNLRMHWAGVDHWNASRSPLGPHSNNAPTGITMRWYKMTKLLIKSTPANQSMADGNVLWKVPTRDKLKPMKLPARLLLAALTLGVGALSPIAPTEASLPKSHASNCCASMNAGGCHSCLKTMGETTSASSCCAAQSVCCAFYFTRAIPFSADMRLLGVVGVSDECAKTRTQRPSVPPPRGVFS